MSGALDAFRLDGKVACLTGAASGIGRAAAEVLAEAGASVVLGDLDATGVQETAQAIGEAGGRAISMSTDVSRQPDVDALVERAMTEHGRLDVMCNIAGVPADGPLLDVREEEFDRLVAINLKSVLFGTQAAVRAMQQGEGGSIINVASGAIDGAVPGYGLYALTKSAVAMLSQTFATEVGVDGIRVNVLAPGVTITGFTGRHLYGEDGSIDQPRYDAFVERMQSMSPIGRVGEAIDQALLILYLASDASRFCTGQIWRANGGQTLPR
jgi:3-oxoacyl-[acyl-carrier protein] reductase